MDSFWAHWSLALSGAFQRVAAKHGMDTQARATHEGSPTFKEIKLSEVWGGIHVSGEGDEATLEERAAAGLAKAANRARQVASAARAAKSSRT
eukprot:11028068-Alexandrium_andersonii.AAC.1